MPSVEEPEKEYEEEEKEKNEEEVWIEAPLHLSSAQRLDTVTVPQFVFLYLIWQIVTIRYYCETGRLVCQRPQLEKIKVRAYSLFPYQSFAPDSSRRQTWSCVWRPANGSRASKLGHSYPDNLNNRTTQYNWNDRVSIRRHRHVYSLFTLELWDFKNVPNMCRHITGGKCKL